MIDLVNSGNGNDTSSLAMNDGELLDYGNVTSYSLSGDDEPIRRKLRAVRQAAVSEKKRTMKLRQELLDLASKNKLSRVRTCDLSLSLVLVFA